MNKPMSETIGYDEIVRMLGGAVGKIRDHHAELSKLDSAIGDGDHGSAMLKAVEAVEKAVEEAAGSEDLKTLLHKVGWNVMSIDGGSTGPLFGSLFVGMSEGVGERERLDAAALAEVFEAGLAKMQKQTKAKPGDKTLMDALVPAVQALREPPDAGGGETPPPDLEAAVKRAARAATDGAEATYDLPARYGRARNLGERTRGHFDPGAVSMSYLFQGFSEGLSRSNQGFSEELFQQR